MIRSLRKAFALQRRVSNLIAGVSLTAGVRSLGSGSHVMSPITIIGGECIQIGDHFSAGPGLRLEAITAHKGGTHSPRIIIGNDVSFGTDCHVGAIACLNIGDKCLFGSGVLITDHNHGSVGTSVAGPAIKDQPLASKGEVTIEEGVWVGEHACILPGVRVGKGAVIAANAVVTRDVPSGGVVGGIPARLIASRPS